MCLCWVHACCERDGFYILRVPISCRGALPSHREAHNWRPLGQLLQSCNGSVQIGHPKHSMRIQLLRLVSSKIQPNWGKKRLLLRGSKQQPAAGSAQLVSVASLSLASSDGWIGAAERAETGGGEPAAALLLRLVLSRFLRSEFVKHADAAFLVFRLTLRFCDQTQGEPI